MRRKRFGDHSRAWQRKTLLARLNKTRREIESYLKDWKACQEKWGKEQFPDDDGMINQLAKIDQTIKQIKDSKA